ncbi:NAD(P)/FAD-dependent oxidoreductase [Oryzicola mucosus]|uniref:Thioredoxin reductase n=1 Tax=Oryzicola mucosus TaxID=2767425 RepID=A0A8J6PGW1_9HYPH|nr:FAD-dependent oxidoreductase [Oryzicola mucosus]MBD0414994.1 NAD(P)/FAD-dependent oxidoreductase [Oryzicola mucosus]
MSDTTDVAVVGAGPAALYAAFQLGLFGIGCRLIEASDRPGGQCTELYGDKPVYDMPAWPALTAQEVVDRLLQQIAPFKPHFEFGCAVSSIIREDSGLFRLSSKDGHAFTAKAVVVAGGTGAFVADEGRRLISCDWRDWGFPGHHGAIEVDTERFETSTPGVFAIGDACTYPGKLPLLVSAFHEAALMVQAIRAQLTAPRRAVVEYSSTSSSLQRRLGVKD